MRAAPRQHAAGPVAAAAAAVVLALAGSVHAGVPTTTAAVAVPTTSPAVVPAIGPLISDAAVPHVVPQDDLTGEATWSSDLADLSLEDLMDVEVTSVSKRPQRILTAPAAVTVIGSQEIERSGMSSIPELLRLAPGTQVAQIDAHRWAVSVRGFNDLYANKLLVLQDGRAVYNPLFAGVYWSTVDYVLEDLQQIEVVRGPGATLWGANAVNGVININSKPADQTQGWLVSARAGTHEEVGTVRYGGQLDEQTFYRAYAKYRYTDNSETASDDPANDRWQAVRGGFRVDRYASPTDALTLQGDAFTTEGDLTINLPFYTVPEGISLPGRFDGDGAYLLGRWTHAAGPDSELSVQAYYDYLNRVDSAQHFEPFGYEQHTLDLDVQHRVRLTPRNELVYGGGYRFSSDEVESVEGLVFDPADDEMHLFSAFVQDDIELVRDRLHLILGSKLEHNSFTGWELQPSARGVWMPDDHTAVWASVSRAVRTPARTSEAGLLTVDRITLPPAMPGFPGTPADVVLRGNTDVESEDLTAFELGYRVQATPAVSLDVAAFYNRYDDLTYVSASTPFFDPTGVPPRVVIPYDLINAYEATTWGGEAAANWAVTDDWILTGSYSYLEIDAMIGRDTGVPPDDSFYEGGDPQHQFQLRSSLRVARDVRINAALFYVDAFSSVPSYARLDANVDWHPRDGLSLKLGVQNALDDRHPEARSSYNAAPDEVPLTAYGQVTWAF